MLKNPKKKYAQKYLKRVMSELKSLKYDWESQSESLCVIPAGMPLGHRRRLPGK